MQVILKHLQFYYAVFFFACLIVRLRSLAAVSYLVYITVIRIRIPAFSDRIPLCTAFQTIVDLLKPLTALKIDSVLRTNGWTCTT